MLALAGLAGAVAASVAVLRAPVGVLEVHAQAASPAALAAPGLLPGPGTMAECVPAPGGFPVTPGAYQTCPGGKTDGFIAAFDLKTGTLVRLPAPVTPDAPK